MTDRVSFVRYSYTFGIVLRVTALVLGGHTYAQTPNDWWYFGNKAGVHFTLGGVVADTSSSMYSSTGCASVSDFDGNLLFYTNGEKIYNHVHQIMPNGNNLAGNNGTTQSSIIVPDPGNCMRYYVFTTAEQWNGGFFAYSVVDMTLDGGLGDVVTEIKNIILFDTAAEKCTAVPHANGKDFWVIGRKEAQAQYHAFLLTDEGISNTVISLVGIPNISGGWFIPNHKGNLLVDATFSVYPLPTMIFNFNRETGVLTFFDSISSPPRYGACFSPNDSLFYLSASWDSAVTQYQVYASNIMASEEVVFQTTSWINAAASIAEGPDGLLYVNFAGVSQPYIARINSPNVIGIGCNLQDSAVFLEPNRGALISFPNQLSLDVWRKRIWFCNGNGCESTVTFFVTDTLSITAALWDFGDPASGSQNTSALVRPVHTFSDTGWFTVTAHITRGNHTDTLTTEVYVRPLTALSLLYDSTACTGDTVVYTALHNGDSLRWFDGSAGNTIATTATQGVWVEAFGECGTASDTALVRVGERFHFAFGTDTLLCGQDSLLLDPNIAVDVEYLWHDSSTAPTFTARQTGKVWLMAQNACDILNDTVKLRFLPVPQPLHLQDTAVCADSFSYTPPIADFDVSLGQVNDVYILTRVNECGMAGDTFRVTLGKPMTSVVISGTPLCELEPATLTVTLTNARYLWNTGDTTASIRITEAGEYRVTVSDPPCEAVLGYDAVTVNCDDTCRVLLPNVITPNGDGLNDALLPMTGCVCDHYELTVWNRWGMTVFHSISPAQPWDGTTPSGKPVSDGTYFYMLTHSFGGKEERHAGSLTVVR